jgi:uncharacterized BrkB/YihY/UPF0761 family membrane protein
MAYAVFGVFLLLLFWSYVTGLVLVLGAELNAFLEDPQLANRSAELRRETNAAQRRAASNPNGCNLCHSSALNL